MVGKEEIFPTLKIQGKMVNLTAFRKVVRRCAKANLDLLSRDTSYLSAKYAPPPAALSWTGKVKQN